MAPSSSSFSELQHRWAHAQDGSTVSRIDLDTADPTKIYPNKARASESYRERQVDVPKLGIAVGSQAKIASRFLTSGQTRRGGFGTRAMDIDAGLPALPVQVFWGNESWYDGVVIAVDVVGQMCQVLVDGFDEEHEFAFEDVQIVVSRLEPTMVLGALWEDGLVYSAVVLEVQPDRTSVLVKYIGFEDMAILRSDHLSIAAEPVTCEALSAVDSTASPIPSRPTHVRWVSSSGRMGYDPSTVSSTRARHARQSSRPLKPDDGFRRPRPPAGPRTNHLKTRSLLNGDQAKPPPFPRPISASETESSQAIDNTQTTNSVSSGAKTTNDTPAVVHESKADKKARMRVTVAQELLSTERTYVENLRLVEDVWLQPLIYANQNSKTQILPQKYIDRIFGSISTIRPFNETLLTEITNRLEAFTADQCIGDVMLQLAPYMKMYTTYVQNFSGATQTLGKLLADKKYERFNVFVDQCRSDPRCQDLSLESFLVMPVQRIPRYKLLLTELLKNTEESNKDYTLLPKALEAIEVVATLMNEDLRPNEKHDEIFKLQSQFIGTVSLVAPSRVIRLRGSLEKMDRSSSYHRLQFFLFSDLLVYASKIGWKFKLKGEIAIDKAFFAISLPDDEIKFKHRILIASSKKSIVIRATNSRDKETWLAGISIAIEELNEAENQRLQSANAGNPPRRLLPERVLPLYLQLAPISNWGLTDVMIWLTIHNFQQHADCFRAFNITGPFLIVLDEDNLVFDMKIDKKDASRIVALAQILAKRRVNEIHQNPFGDGLPTDVESHSQFQKIPKTLAISGRSRDAEGTVLFHIYLEIAGTNRLVCKRSWADFRNLEATRIRSDKTFKLVFQFPESQDFLASLNKQAQLELYLRGLASFPEFATEVAEFLNVEQETLARACEPPVSKRSSLMSQTNSTETEYEGSHLSSDSLFTPKAMRLLGIESQPEPAQGSQDNQVHLSSHSDNVHHTTASSSYTGRLKYQWPRMSPFSSIHSSQSSDSQSRFPPDNRTQSRFSTEPPPREPPSAKRGQEPPHYLQRNNKLQQQRIQQELSRIQSEEPKGLLRGFNPIARTESLHNERRRSQSPPPIDRSSSVPRITNSIAAEAMAHFQQASERRSKQKFHKTTASEDMTSSSSSCSPKLIPKEQRIREFEPSFEGSKEDSDSTSSSENKRKDFGPSKAALKVSYLAQKNGAYRPSKDFSDNPNNVLAAKEFWNNLHQPLSEI